MNSIKNTQIALENLGQMSYQTTWDLQEEKLKSIVNQKKENRTANPVEPTMNYFYWVEHPPVITLGKSGKANHLLLNPEELQNKGIEFLKTNRGGDITFHGPGQLVGYPILDLENFFTDIHRYLRLLEEAIILTLDEFGLKGDRSQGETGVWLDVNTPFPRKICAMGVKASRWVTMHGFALNVSTDLSYFDYIIPCGIQGKGVTSLSKELEREVTLEEVRPIVEKHFQTLFKARFTTL